MVEHIKNNNMRSPEKYRMNEEEKEVTFNIVEVGVGRRES